MVCLTAELSFGFRTLAYCSRMLLSATAGCNQLRRRKLYQPGAEQGHACCTSLLFPHRGPPLLLMGACCHGGSAPALRWIDCRISEHIELGSPGSKPSEACRASQLAAPLSRSGHQHLGCGPLSSGIPRWASSMITTHIACGFRAQESWISWRQQVSSPRLV